MNKTYRVAIEGVRQDFETDQVVGELVALFKQTPEQVRALLAGKGVVVKKGVDLATANKYREALERRGCACLIAPEGGQAVSVAAIPDVVATPPKIEDSSASTPPPRAARSSKPGERASTDSQFNTTIVLEGGHGTKPGHGLQLQPVEKPPAIPSAPDNFESPAARSHYAAPSATVADSPSDDGTIREVARFQRMMLMSILASFASNGIAKASPGPLAVLLLIGVGIFSIWAVYRLCRALDLSAVLWVVAMFVPLVNLIGMVYINRKATRFLKEQGLSVGLLGAKL